MKVTIRFFAVFGELFGKSVVVENSSMTSVFQAIHSIAGQNKKGYEAVFDESGKFRDFVIIMKNGRRLSHSEASDTVLADGDEIAVFPPVAGG